jgi:hypothetical protein
VHIDEVDGATEKASFSSCHAWTVRLACVRSSVGD